MELIKKLFGIEEKRRDLKINWINLSEDSQLMDIETSKRVLGIFKHSTRCFTSKIVLKEFENNFELSSNQIEMYYLDLIAYRNISDEIERKYGIRHESPQLLIIKNNKVVTHASHSRIIQLKLETYS